MHPLIAARQQGASGEQTGPTLLVVAYRLRVPSGAFLERAADAAPQIAGAPGLAWKIWGLDAATGEGTSAYLFHDRASAEAFAAGPVIAALREGPASGVEVRIAPVDQALSTITKATPALAA